MGGVAYVFDPDRQENNIHVFDSDNRRGGIFDPIYQFLHGYHLKPTTL